MNKIITKNYVYILIVAFMLSFSIGFFTTSYGLNEEASVGAQSEQYDKMKVTFVNIESRKTGTTFDTISDAVPASDMDGHDVSPDDNYVKTYDTITYVLEVGIERNEATTSPSDIIKGGKIKVRVKIPTGEDGRSTLSIKNDAWMKSFTYDYNIYNFTEITAYYEIPSNKSAIGGAQQLSFTFGVSGNERILSGDELPIFEVWMEGNQPDNSDSVIESKSVQDTNPIIVTGKIDTRLDMSVGYVNDKGERDGVKGQYISLLTRVYNLTGKGYENPEHHLSSKLRIKYEYKDLSVEGSNWVELKDADDNPDINGTTMIAYGRPGETTEGFWPTSSWNKSLNTNFYAKWSTYTSNSARIKFDSGVMTASQDGNIISFANDDFYNYSVYDSSSYKTLAAQGFEFFVPWYEPEEGHRYQYRITIYDNELQVQNHDGVDQDPTDPKRSISFTFYNTLSGVFSYELYGDSFIYEPNSTSSTYQYDYSEMKSLAMGKRRDFYSYITSSDGPYEGGLERLIVWNSESVELSTYKLPYYSYSNSGIYSSPKSSDNTMKYGIYKADREHGVLTNDLVNSATFDDFDWYDTVEDATSHGKITAIWSDEPTWHGYKCAAYIYIYLKPIDDINNVGKSGIIRHKITVYADAERTIKYQIGYKASDDYVAAVINDAGTGLKSNASPYAIGETYFITGIILNIGHGTSKSNYNVEEELASYTITPIFSVGVENPTGTADFKVWISVPKDLSYYPNGSNYEPVSVVDNSNGTQTVTWEFKDWSLEDPLPKITYKVEMSPYMKNNISKTITAYISSPSVLTGSKSQSSSASFTNLAGSSLRKKIEKEYLELGDSTNIYDYIYNIAQRILLDVKTVEILPKNGDAIGSSFSGTYTIKVISLADTQKMYYTTNSTDNIGLEPDPFGKLNIKNVDLDNDDRWIEVHVGDTIPSNATAIATYMPEVGQESDVHYVTEFIPSGNTYLDKYYFQVTASSSVMDNAFSSELKRIGIVDRKISGIVFIDKNKDGKYNNNDSLLANKNVYLYDDEDNLIRTMTTDANGYYESEHFVRGNYYIKYNLGSGETFTAKNAGSAAISSVINPNTGNSDSITEFSQTPNNDLMYAQNKNVGLQAAPARVISHFYIINSETKVHEDVVLDNNMFYGDYYEVNPLAISMLDEPYNTTYEIALDENDNPVTSGDPKEGLITKEVMEVNFFYRPKPATITVHHYFEGTTTKAFEDVQFEKTYGQRYEALRIDTDLYRNAGYDTNYDQPNGVVSRPSYEVIYYYQIKKGTVTAHHYIKGTTTKVHDDDIDEYEYGLPYSTRKYEPDELDEAYANKYFYDSYASVDEPNGTVSKDNYEMTYYYKSKSATILVHHYIYGTQIKVHPDVQLTGIYGADYQTTYLDTKQLDYEYQNKYFYNSYEGDAPTGTISKDRYEVTYYYGVQNATVTVHHYIDGTTTKVHEDDVISKMFFEGYTTRAYNPGDLVDPYTNKYVYKNKNAGDGVSGVVGKTSYEVIYYYELGDAEIITHYYKLGTEEKVQDSKIMYKKMNENYNTRPLETEELYNSYKNKYVYSETSSGDDPSGIVSKTKYIIIYYYEPAIATVTVHHYEISKDGNRTTNKVHADDVYDKRYNDSYTTSYYGSNDLSGNYKNNYYYNNVKDGADVEGIVNTDNVVVNYYYEAKPSRVVVHHYVVGTTNKVHADDVYNKLYTDTYETRPFNTEDLIGDYQNNYYYNGIYDGDALSGTINKDSYEIIYYYTLRPSTMTVHHYAKGTTTKVHDDDVSVMDYTTPYNIVPYEPSGLTGNYTNNYYYNGEHTGDNLTGTISKDNYEITIYYEPRPSTVMVHHYIKDTVTKVHKDDIIEKHYGDTYETNYYSTGEIDNPYKNIYTYVSSDGDSTSGTIRKDNYEITYYYDLRPSTLTVHHYITGTTTKVHDDDVIAKKYTEEYTTKPYDTSELTGTYQNWYTYNNVHEGDAVSGVIIGDSYEVTYFYDKLPAKLTVHHYFEGTSSSIADDETYNLKLRDHYETSAKESSELNKPNYTYSSISGEASGEINDPELEITYYYKLKEAQLIVHHIAEDTGLELCYDETSDVTYQDFYSVDTCTTLNDINYTYKRVETNDVNAEQRGTRLVGNILQDVVEITYYYELKPGQIVVHYFEVGTRDRVADDVIADGLASKEFISEAKEITGFTLVNEPESVHYFEVDTQEVIYEYERIKFNITVEVIGGIGDITGAEQVEYGKDSTEDFIVITPGEGYEIDEIIIDDQVLEGIETLDGMTLGNFKFVDRDHHVQVSFKEKVIPVPITGSNTKLIVAAIILAIVTIVYVLFQNGTLQLRTKRR